jgi:hypothetical protein
MTEQEFNYFLECSLKISEKNTWILHYDPKIPETFKLKEGQTEVWMSFIYLMSLYFSRVRFAAMLTM